MTHQGLGAGNWAIFTLASFVLLCSFLLCATGAPKGNKNDEKNQIKGKTTEKPSIGHNSSNSKSSSYNTSNSNNSSYSNSFSYSDNNAPASSVGHPNQGFQSGFNFPQQQAGRNNQNPGFNTQQGFGGYQGPNQGFMGGNMFGG